jgi:GT2 family glycosyltransferase
MPKIGLVTVLYNSEDVLEGFFKSLSEQTFKDYHLYIVDNKVTEETNNLITSLLSKYPVIEYTHVKNSANLGVAKGNNQGIELSLKNGADYVLLLNNDVEFYTPDLIKEMVDYAEKGEDIIVPKILYFDTRRIWMAGGKLLKTRGYTIHIGDGEKNSPKYATNKYFDYAPTCFMLISKKVFEKVGLMDERYFVYFDDTDFIYRANNLGYKVYYIGNVEVLHKVSNSTGGNETLFSIYYHNRNRMLFIRKNFKGLNKILPLLYFFSTRIFKLLIYNKQQRNKLISGFKDGLKLA